MTEARVSRAQRYEPREGYDPAQDGSWVLASDYDALRAEHDRLLAERDTLARRVAELEDGLRNLRNESSAILAMSYDEIKASAGYTNLSVFKLRVDEATALLPAPPVTGGPHE